jgi:arylsulfatase A-like enzyme
MGSSFACSPNIDALASRGLLFTQAHSASPVCMPARCSMLSGLHAPLHGCTENGLKRRTGIPVFTDTLKDAGYHTIMAGKCHFGPLPSSFDAAYTVSGEKGAASNDYFGEELRRRGYSRSSAHPNPVPEKDCLESIIVDKTIESMEGALKTGEPFFAWCSLLSPHSPLDPPGQWMNGGIFKGEIPNPVYKKNEWEKLPGAVKRFCGIPNPEQRNCEPPQSLLEARGNIADNLGMAEMREHNELYYRSAAYVDSLVGRLISFLDDSGLRENTLVIFTSDHGIQNFDHGFNDKHNYYDQSLRVPFIMSLPGVLPENEKRGFASHVDLASTIAAAAGRVCDFANGFDLFSPFLRREEIPRRWAVSSLYGSLALVTQRWKLEYYYFDDETRLFDRLNDPGEEKDLSGDGNFSELKAFLCRALLSWRAGLMDTREIQQNTGPGGPVAGRVINDIKSRKGCDNEIRLGELLDQMPSRFI